MSKAAEMQGMRDEDGDIRPKFVSAINAAVAAEDTRSARKLTRELHEADLADLIELLSSESRVKLIRLLGRTFDVEALPRLDEPVRDDLMEALPNDVIAAAIRRLDTDDALYLIENLDEIDRQEILDKLSKTDRAALRRALDYPEGAAGRLMKTEFVAIPDFWTVGQTIDHMRESRGLPDEFVEIYVTDPTFRLAGSVPLSRILRSRRDSALADPDCETRPTRCGRAPTSRRGSGLQVRPSTISFRPAVTRRRRTPRRMMHGRQTSSSSTRRRRRHAAAGRCGRR